MGMKKTTFNDILRVVNKSTGHGLSARLDTMRKRQGAHLKELGVRMHNRSSNTVPEYSEKYHDIYHHAYEALKKSNRSWATDSEIKAILYGNKELSRERSAELIEIMRRSGVPGFKETDAATPGDVYSERLMNVIKRHQTTEEHSDFGAIMDKVSARDKRNTSVTPGATHRAMDEHDEEPMKIVHLETQPEHETNRQFTPTNRTLPGAMRLNTTQSNAMNTPQKKSGELPPTDPENIENEDIPLTRDLDDPDI